ncbi:MAG: cysteine desulfurase family protein [Thermomicrobiales bacterium]|nr:cysteine desulfurase [Thermomicrobiales bacterium]
MPDSQGVYLDHAATTPLDPVVLAAMEPYLTAAYGNPSSLYRLGQEARAAVDTARAQAASVLGCAPGEVLFTSGATESNNLALRGAAWGARLAAPEKPPPHLVTTAIEHHAVLHTAESLARQGFRVTFVRPDQEGIVSAASIASAVEHDTCLISVMLANNETGVIQPIAEIAAVAQEHNIRLHTDAVQGAGLLSLDVEDLGVDLLALSAHKFYGPKGVGLLYVRQGTLLDYQQTGGGQEQGRRGGTENVAGVAGLGVALQRAESFRVAYAAHCRAMRDQLAAGIFAALPDAILNGPPLEGPRLPNNLNVSIPGIQGETMLLALDLLDVAASAGSACTTGNSEPSHVLTAMGLSAETCRSALRFTVGRGTTPDEIVAAVEAVVEAAARVRSLAGV